MKQLRRSEIFATILLTIQQQTSRGISLHNGHWFCKIYRLTGGWSVGNEKQSTMVTDGLFI